MCENLLPPLGTGAANAIAAIKALFPSEFHSRVFLVGGSVRDHLMGQSICDVDLVTDLPVGQLVKLGFHHVKGKSTAPIYFNSHPQFGKLEVTVLERGHALEDDLQRRDFRCNAIVMTLDGTIVDPLEGLCDVNNKLLTPCSADALEKDPLRMFRAFRFESHGWRMTDELLTLITARSWDDRLSTIPVERFSREMLRAMEGEQPDIFFSRMLELDVGRCYLPEIFQMQDVPAGPVKYHGEDTVFSHSRDALRRMATLTDAPVVRLAAFFHDLGKLATLPEMLPRHIGHDKAGAATAKEFCTRLKLPTCYCRAVTAINALHLVAGRWHELKPATKLKLARQTLKSGIAAWLPLIVSADRDVDNPMPGWEIACKAAAMSATELGILPEALEKVLPSGRQPLVWQFQMEKYKEMTN
ncbi:MAG: HD domain-containing protein [Desulfuromonadales bacterium]